MNKYFFISFFFLPFFIACQKDKPQSKTKEVTSDIPSSAFYVRTVPIEESQLSDVIHITGIIQSDSDAKPSFKTGGVISNTYVKEGDAVRKGQLLAKLNMTEIEAQATQAQFALDKAKRDQQRIQNLYADSVATLEQMQNASTAVEIAQKTLQIAQFNVDYSQVRAPIDGKVVTQMLHEGEIAAPGLPVFYIIGVKASDWKLVAGLTDKNWSRVKEGNKAKILLDAYPELEMTGTVKRLSDVANPLSGTFDVEISIPAKDKRIASGMLAHIEIIPSKGRAYPIIPIEALVSSNGKSGVVYVPNNGHAEKRVVIIQQFDGERVAILSGLENATEVITAGSGFLENGDVIVSEK
jgi:multidrug efflux system membrane fusion protein